jgi:hypothetical protein
MVLWRPRRRPIAVHPPASPCPQVGRSLGRYRLAGSSGVSGRVRRWVVTAAQADARQDGPWRLTLGAGCASVRRSPATAGGSGVRSDWPMSPHSSGAGGCCVRVDHGRSGATCLSDGCPTAHRRWRDRPSSTSMIRVSEQPTRWGMATVYPDMWVDPDEDPRNSDGVSPDGELATLQDYLSGY